MFYHQAKAFKGWNKIQSFWSKSLWWTHALFISSSCVVSLSVCSCVSEDELLWHPVWHRCREVDETQSVVMLTQSVRFISSDVSVSSDVSLSLCDACILTQCVSSVKKALSFHQLPPKCLITQIRRVHAGRRPHKYSVSQPIPHEDFYSIRPLSPLTGHLVSTIE